jgi:hypothetical protein
LGQQLGRSPPDIAEAGFKLLPANWPIEDWQNRTFKLPRFCLERPKKLHRVVPPEGAAGAAAGTAVPAAGAAGAGWPHEVTLKESTLIKALPQSFQVFMNHFLCLG